MWFQRVVRVAGCAVLLSIAGAAPATQPAGGNTELARDDGTSAGKRSIAGGGHAVTFDVPAEGTWSLSAVKIYGSRYGYPQPPKEDFKVWLCSADGKALKTFTFPYARFERGEAKWVTLKTPPTQVPATFMLCVGFNPAQTRGVYVHFDAAGSGHSKQGLPGDGLSAFDSGDWMMRAIVEPAKN